MTVTTDLLLEATGVSKTYGAVVALKSASLAVRPGEVHALVGANGAGKSTFVKILTGAVHPDAGRIVVRGRERTVHSPAEARRGGLVSVYQEPALIPDLDIRANLRLTETPLEPFRHWLAELGLADLDLSSLARRLPLASLRIIDLARALAIEPDVLMLDEMTAALPANLTERVLEVIGAPARRRPLRHLHLAPADRDRRRLRPGDRSARGRDGRRRRRDRRLRGEDRRADARPERRRPRGADRRPGRPGVSGARRRPHGSRLASLSSGTRLHDASFDLYPGEVLGVVALEGQGQDELFDILAGSERPRGGELLVDGKPVSFRHPADAIRAGLVYVAADRAEALLMQRSIRENIALPFTTRLRRWGLIDLGGERERVDGRRRDAPDRRPGRRRGAASLGRQPAEGDDRALGRGRGPGPCCASTRRAGSTSAPRPRSTGCCGTWPRQAPRSCSTPRS